MKHYHFRLSIVICCDSKEEAEQIEGAYARHSAKLLAQGVQSAMLSTFEESSDEPHSPAVSKEMN